MNKYIVFGLLIIFFSSCNDEKADKVPQNTSSSPSAEQLLMDDIKQYPDSLILKENLIQYYRENGNYDNALKEVNNAIQKDTANPRLWQIKAMLHVENEDTLSAINSFEKTVRLFPTPSDIISLGTLYADTKNPASLQMADALIAIDNNKAEKEALFIKGLYYSAINEKEKAIGFFNKCLEINYSFMYAYREKCIALYDLGKYKEALEVITKAITLQNGYEEGYYYEGRCLEKLNRMADAIESYQTALMYAPDYIEAREALAKLGVKS